MRFEADEHYVQSVNIEDYDHHGITEIRAVHWEDPPKSLHTVLTLRTGACNIQIKITSDEARKLAAMLQDFSAKADAHQQQLALDEVAA